MTIIASIVEGDGEVAAVPILLRRIGEWLSPERGVMPLQPIRVRRDRFLNRDEEFRRHLLLAAAKCGSDGWILVLLDADDDCPAVLGAQILRRAREHVPHRRVSVVLANREYEAWFLAAAKSLHGRRGFIFDGLDEVDSDIARNAKGRISAAMITGAYRETTDQPAFSALMNLQDARARSRSFKKLCDEYCRQTVS